MKKRAVLHVIQASYGDALLLEYDPSSKKNSPTVQFMLIDGGPCGITRHYVEPSVGKPKHNLFDLLNYLSGETRPQPEFGLLDTLETVVLTHDDEDHKRGIQDLFAAFIEEPLPDKSDKFNLWLKGNEKVAEGKSPILHIWYNSLENLTKFEGVTPQEGWFDKQLSELAKLTPVVWFNDELEITKKGVPIAMCGIKSRSGSMVMKGQFAVQFLGPLNKALNQRLINKMGKSVDLPKYKYYVEMKAMLTGISALDDAKKLAEANNEVRDPSFTNRSSIAFDAEDKASNTRILLLGDSTAQIFEDNYKKTRSPTSYSLMKVMHHGSSHNNYWSSDKWRKKEEAALPLLTGLDSLQLAVIYFFAKVRAKKYVISASAFEIHPNPHQTTVIGIIAAALETGATIDVYLTNWLSPWVVKVVGDFLEKNKLDLSAIHMHLMARTAKSGAIDLYGDTSSANWERFDWSGKDIWSTYPAMLKKEYKEIADLEVAYPVIPLRGKRLRSGRIIPPPTIRKTILLPRTSAIIPHTRLQSPGKFGFQLPPQAPAFVRVPRSERTVSSMLLGTPLKVNHDQLWKNKPPDTRAFTTLADLLQYLVGQGCLSSAAAASILSEATTEGGYVLCALTTLFMGKEVSETFLASLPCDLSSTTDYLSDDGSPSFWVASNFVATVIVSDLPVLRGWRGIYSASFDIGTQNDRYPTWHLPFGTASPDQMSNVYSFQHCRPMSIKILWPSYLMRLISGQFKGTLQLNTTIYHVVAEFLLCYEQPTEYVFKFSDENYKTHDFKISIGDVLRLLNCTDVDFAGNLGRIILPGLESVLDDLKDSTGLSNGQFMLQRILSRVLLKGISGEVIFDNAVSNWQPFGGTEFSFTIEKLRASLCQINSVPDRKLCIQLHGCMDFSDVSGNDIKIPIQLSASFTLEGFMLFEVILFPANDDSLSISQLLDIIGLPDLDFGASFPAVANLTNALSITHVSMGWTSSLLPDFFKLVISLDDWDIMGDALRISKIEVEIQADNLSSDGPMTLCLHGWGSVEIAGIELELYFNFAHAGGADSVDMISVQIAAEGRLISLGAIVKHFFGDGFSLLPPAFINILDETGIDDFMIQAIRDGSSWSISQLQLSIRVQTSLDIFAAVSLEYPTLLLDVHYPFDSARRTISACINATLNIGDVPSKVSIIVTAEDKTEIAVVFTPSGPPLTVNDVVGQLISDSTTITLPESVSFLANVGLQEASASMQLDNGKFGLSRLLVSVISTTSLKLWNEMTLEEVSLLLSYTKGTEMVAQFHAMLVISDNNYLDFSVVYKSTSQSSDSGGTSGGGSSLIATATYSSTISALDILGRISGINLRDCFEGVSLSALIGVVDINMSNLTVILTHDPVTNAFSFDADTNWLCFSHLHFSCSKSQGWSYSLGFCLRPDIDVLQYIPILGPLINSKVTLTDTAVVVFNHILDVAALPTTLTIPATSTISQSLFNVAFVGRLALTNSPLRTLAKVLDVDTVDILGIVGDEYLYLSMSVKPVYFWNGEVSLAGSIVLTCSDETEMLPKVGIQGTAILNFGAQVSENPITTSLFLFVDFGTTALGFKFTLDKWEHVFGYNGLNFKNVVFEAEFPPEEFPVPSEFTVSGTVDLSVNQSRFYGSVDLHFVELDILKSFATGSIEGLTLNNIVAAFSNVDNVPGYADLGFGPLEFKIVPIDLVDSMGNVLKQQLFMRGSFNVPSVHLSGDGDVDISLSHVAVDGHLSGIVVLDKKLLSILASSNENPPPPSGSGPSIHVSINNSSSPFGVKISGRMTFLSVSNDIYLDLSSDGLTFKIEWVTNESMTVIVDKKKIVVSASYTFPLDLLIPELQIGSVLFGDVLIETFGASLGVTVIWSVGSWTLIITGNIVIHGLTISKSFTVGTDLKDLNSLTKHISSAIGNSFASDLLTTLKNLSDIQLVLTILQGFGLPLFDMITFISESCGVDADRIPDIVEALLALGFSSLLIVDVLVEIYSISAVELWKLIGGVETRRDVQDKLELILATNANNGLRNSLTVTRSDQLSTILCQYANALFKKQFGYDYNGTLTTPSNAISPVKLFAANGMTSFVDGKQDHVNDFVKQMLNAQDVPSWMDDQARNDLLNWIKNLVDIYTGNDWQHINLVQTYNPSDSTQNSIRANTALIFVNGSLTIDDVTVSETVLYYVGVYFEVLTPSAAGRQKLRTDAYNKASSVMNNNTAITDDASLEIALQSYSKTVFNSHFSYIWGGEPSDYTNAGSYLKVSADAVGYFEDGKTDAVDATVKNVLLKGISLPTWTSDNIVSDTIGEFTGIMSIGPYNGSWTSLNVDKTYDDSNGIHDSVRVNAVMVYYLDSKTLDNGTTVKISYIFWMGMFYEKPSPATLIYADMIKKLYNNLHSAMSDVSIDNLTPNKAGLIALLSRCASSQFKTDFNYDFNSSSTTPTDSNGNEVYGVQCFGEFKDASKSVVSAWTTDNIFKDGTFSFFKTVSDLKSALDNQIVSWLTNETATTSDNNWGISEYERSNNDPSDSSKGIETAGVAFYANGSLTESGTVVKANYVYYMGVYYVTDYSDTSSDV